MSMHSFLPSAAPFTRYRCVTNVLLVYGGGCGGVWVVVYVGDVWWWCIVLVYCDGGGGIWLWFVVVCGGVVCGGV